MGTAALWNRTLHGELNAHAAWLPVVNTLKLGDYGLVSDGIFAPMGNVDEFGVGFQEEQGPPAALDFRSKGTRLVRFVGNAEVDAFPDAPIEAKLAIRFGQESSFLAKASRVTVHQIRNLAQVARSLAGAPGWNRGWRVVWGVYVGHGCAVVTTRAANASLELGGKANALAKFDLGAIDAEVNVAREENVGFRVVGKTGVIALRLFKLKLWGNGAALLGAGEGAEIERDEQADLEDDV